MRMDRRAGLLSATNKYAWKKYALRYEPVVVYNRYGYLSLTPLSTYEKITESSTTTTTRSSAFYVGTTYSYDSSKQSGFTIDHTTSIAVSSSGASTAKNKYML